MVERDEYYVHDTLNIPYLDNLIIDEINYIDDSKIIIDNSITDIVIDISKLDGVDIKTFTHSVWNNDREYSWLSIYSDGYEYNYLKMALDGLKNKEILVGGSSFKIDKIYISLDNLTKLKENYQNYQELFY